MFTFCSQLRSLLHLYPELFSRPENGLKPQKPETPLLEVWIRFITSVLLRFYVLCLCRRRPMGKHIAWVTCGETFLFSIQKSCVLICCAPVFIRLNGSEHKTRFSYPNFFGKYVPESRHIWFLADVTRAGMAQQKKSTEFIIHIITRSYINSSES